MHLKLPGTAFLSMQDIVTPDTAVIPSETQIRDSRNRVLRRRFTYFMQNAHFTVRFLTMLMTKRPPLFNQCVIF